MLVDCVVVSTPEHHPQTWGTQYSPAMSGELRVPLSSIPPLELSVPVAVNDDNFYLAPDVADAYASGARGLAERYYESVSRYTTSSFMRLSSAFTSPNADLPRISTKAAGKHSTG